MHSYPAWKIWLVFVVLALGLLLALPNLFGDAPALQLSRNDRTAVTDAGKQQILATLQSQGIAPESAYLEVDRLVLRFRDVDQQIKARDVMQDSSGREYLTALSHVPRTPAWMRSIGLQPMSLGLDLRGGVYFMYEVDTKGAVTQLLQSMESDYRTLLRKERIPFTAVTSNGADGVRIVLRSGEDAQKVTGLLRKQDPNLTVNTDVLGDGGSVSVTLSPAQIKQRQDFAIEQNITTLRNRVDELGVTEPIVARQGIDRTDQLWQFEVGQSLFEESAQLRLVNARAILQHGSYLFAKLGMGQTKHGSIGDSGMAKQCCLDFRRIDIDPA